MRAVQPFDRPVANKRDGDGRACAIKGDERRIGNTAKPAQIEADEPLTVHDFSRHECLRIRRVVLYPYPWM